MMERKIVLGIGGSSGAIYAARFLEKTRNLPQLQLGVVMSENAKINWELEIGPFDATLFSHVRFYDAHDFFAPFASGSAKYDSMVVMPSSMGLLARIASGFSSDLVTRAADVILKEKRKLIIVPRETPFNLIHIKNMEQLVLAGAIICPATPSFYSQPKTIIELVDTVVDRVLDLLDLNIENIPRWGSNIDQ
ncbi:MAG: UbiX family flavin prenyltransferase [Saprospiraceae bacterium]|nr:UbiX family flavin prenyltransferase [Saprospiraceae bacterium]